MNRRQVIAMMAAIALGFVVGRWVLPAVYEAIAMRHCRVLWGTAVDCTEARR